MQIISFWLTWARWDPHKRALIGDFKNTTKCLKSRNTMGTLQWYPLLHAKVIVHRMPYMKLGIMHQWASSWMVRDTKRKPTTPWVHLDWNGHLRFILCLEKCSYQHTKKQTQYKHSNCKKKQEFMTKRFILNYMTVTNTRRVTEYERTNVGDYEIQKLWQYCKTLITFI